MAAAVDRYPWTDDGAVAGVVVTDPKGQFERHGATPTGVDPVVFAVDCTSLTEAFRITKRGHETYTVDRVPPASLRLVEN